MSQEEEPAPGFEGRNSSPPADTWPTEQHQTPEQLPKQPQFRVSLDGSSPNSPKAMEIEDRYRQASNANMYSALWGDVVDEEVNAPARRTRGSEVKYSEALALYQPPDTPPV